MLKWFAVKTLYRTTVARAPWSLVEERVVIFRARSFADASRQGESEARKYAASPRRQNADGKRVRTKYLGECDAFELFAAPAHGREVYSCTELARSTTSARGLGDKLLGAPENARVRRIFE